MGAVDAGAVDAGAVDAGAVDASSPIALCFHKFKKYKVTYILTISPFLISMSGSLVSGVK